MKTGLSRPTSVPESRSKCRWRKNRLVGDTLRVAIAKEARISIDPGSREAAQKIAEREIRELARYVP